MRWKKNLSFIHLILHGSLVKWFELLFAQFFFIFFLLRLDLSVLMVNTHNTNDPYLSYWEHTCPLKFPCMHTLISWTVVSLRCSVSLNSVQFCLKWFLKYQVPIPPPSTVLCIVVAVVHCFAAAALTLEDDDDDQWCVHTHWEEKPH